MRRSRSLLCACVVFGSLVWSGASRAQPTKNATDEPMSEQARELFTEGKRLLRDGKVLQAEAALEAAWALALKSKGIAANLGDCEMKLGKHREAAEHLAISLRLAAPNDPQRAHTAENLAAVKAKIGTLVVTAGPAGAEVLLDGKKVGEAPLLDPVFVDPGHVKVRVRMEGFTSWEKELDVTAGQEVPLAVTLEKPAPAPSVTATATSSATAPPAPNRVPSYVAFGVGGAGLVLGAITGGMSLAAYGDVRNACGGTSHCPASQRDAVNSGGTLADISTIGFVVAGVGLAAGVTLWLVPLGGSSKATTALTVGPSFVGVKGAF